MAHKCPSCSHEFEISGVVPRAEVATQVAAKAAEVTAAKDAEIALLNSTITELRPQAAATATLQARLDEAVAELTGIKSAEANASALRAAGVPDQLHQDFLTLHQSSQAGKPDDGKQDLASWLAADDGAKASPLLAGHLGTAEAPEPEAGATIPDNGGAMGRVLPNSSRGAAASAAPGTQGKMSEAQMFDLLMSPQVQSLPATERKAKIAEYARKAGVPIPPVFMPE